MAGGVKTLFHFPETSVALCLCYPNVVSFPRLELTPGVIQPNNGKSATSRIVFPTSPYRRIWCGNYDLLGTGCFPRFGSFSKKGINVFLSILSGKLYENLYVGHCFDKNDVYISKRGKLPFQIEWSIDCSD